jgi:16S rRNA (uracil1498-N3)-methyltransferase
MPHLQRLIVQSHQITDQQLTLTSDQQHYLYTVLRLHQGDRFLALDGRGKTWLTQLEQPSQAILLESIEAIAAPTELPIAITLLMAIPKNGMDDLIRQATELGVTQIVPVISDRTLPKPSGNKRDRWQRIVQEAAEQSERQIVPEIFEPQKFAAAVETWNNQASQCYLCEARGEQPHLLKQVQLGRSLVIAIGCEGGWTDGEIERAIAQGYQLVSLGSRILRAVTAPIAALAVIAAVLESDL